MCTSKPKPPPVVVRDPVKEAADAANEAAGKANMAIAAKRKLRRESSLLTTGPQGSPGRSGSLLTTIAKGMVGAPQQAPATGQSGSLAFAVANAMLKR